MGIDKPSSVARLWNPKILGRLSDAEHPKHSINITNQGIELHVRGHKNPSLLKLKSENDILKATLIERDDNGGSVEESTADIQIGEDILITLFKQKLTIRVLMVDERENGTVVLAQFGVKRGSAISINIVPIHTDAPSDPNPLKRA